MRLCPQYKVLPTLGTPASAEALTSLFNIIKQVPGDETSKLHKERHQQKVTNAAQIFIAEMLYFRTEINSWTLFMTKAKFIDRSDQKY